jgi:hypothetical protein
MTEYKAPDGVTFQLNDATVSDLTTLAFITRRPTNDLAAVAIEQLRNTLVPSTKEPAARAARKAKGGTS